MERISSELSLNSHSKLSEIIPYDEPTCNLELNHDLCVNTTDGALKNISSMLFDENPDENNDFNAEEDSLQAVEKSFCDILGQNYPPSHGNLPQSNQTQGCATKSTVTFPDSKYDINFPIVEFSKGLEEGMGFLPSVVENKSRFYIHSDNMLGFPSNSKKGSNLVGKKIKHAKEEDRDLTILPDKRQTNSKDLSMLTGKRQFNYGYLSLMEERKCKIPVLYFNNRDEAFDNVSRLHEEQYVKEVICLREIKQREIKLHHKKEIYGNLVDLRSLLIKCAEAISRSDTKHAHQLIKQIRKHSSPDGSSDQRMAHIFVSGLEARLNGSDGELCQELVVPQENIIDHLNRSLMSLILSPLCFTSQYFANHTILNAIKRGTKLHIIHLGIENDFHWPCLIHALSQRKGGPPKLRITGIDTLAPAFSSTARLEVTGRRLEGCARSFGVPFEYRGIGAKWDEIRIEDLNIDKDEVLVVNCLQGLAFLGDETDITYSPKNQFFDIIRRIKPKVFIQGIINGSYNSPFFVDRFKQVLLHHSAMFDLVDNNIPGGNNKQRWYLENYLGRVAINVIACEGSKRFVRPETYKQWHVRNLRAEYDQLPLDYAIIKKIKGKASEAYKNDFFIQDDKEWLLWGWKGRVIGALSTWRPR